MKQCVFTVCGTPKESVHAVAATEPTVIVPVKSDESAESEGVVPHEESTGAVELAETCPIMSTANIGPVDEALQSSNRFAPYVVDAVYAVTMGEPKGSAIVNPVGSEKVVVPFTIDIAGTVEVAMAVEVAKKKLPEIERRFHVGFAVELSLKTNCEPVDEAIVNIPP